jgi:hypothetical protein
MHVYSQAEIDDFKRCITDLWRQASRSALEMGVYLSGLRMGMPASDFSAYVENDLSRLGISRSTAYRWIVLAQEIRDLFPNRHIPEALVRLTSGRGIFAASSDSNTQPRQEGSGFTKEEVQPLPARITPAAQEALSTLPAPPEEHFGQWQAEAWAASFVQAMKEARARRSAEARAARKTEAGQAKQRQAFLSKLHDLAASCSPEALREFREQLNQILGKDKEEHDASPEAQPVEYRPVKEEALGNGAASSATPVSQSQNRTANLSPATHVKESDPGSVPATVNHLDKDRMRSGASPAPASQSDVLAAKPPQPPIGTEEHPWRNTGRRPPAWIINLVDRSDNGRVQGGASPAPASPGAVPAVKPPQSQNRTGSPSQPREAATVFKPQPEDRKSGKTMYPDEPRRSSVFSQDFVFSVP